MLAPGCWIHASERPPPLNRPSCEQPNFLQSSVAIQPASLWAGPAVTCSCGRSSPIWACCMHAGAPPPRHSAGCTSGSVAPRVLRITCTCLGLFQGRGPLARPVVTPSVEPCLASRRLPAMAQLTITARMTVPQVRPGGAKGWAGPPPPAGRRRAHAPPASSRSASLSLPLQPALRRARVYWDLGERPSSCWSAAAPQRRSAVPACRHSVLPWLQCSVDSPSMLDPPAHTNLQTTWRPATRSTRW